MVNIFKKFIIIPLLLIFIWVSGILYLALNDDISLSVLSKTGSKSIFKSYTTKNMLPPKPIVGDFLAYENNLGMIAIRFNTHGKSIKNVIKFRLKEKLSNHWYFETQINTDQFNDQQLFPFGFPIITISKNRAYQFEIKLLREDHNNLIALSNHHPVFISRYQFDKNKLKKNPLYLTYFAFRKSQVALEDKNKFYLSLTFLSPLLIYFLFQIFLKPFLSKNLFNISIPILTPLNNIGILIFLLFLLIEILFTKTLIYPLDLIFTFLWFFLIRKYQINYRFSLILASICYFITTILTQININQYVDKIVFFGGIFLLTGSFQLWQNNLN